MDDAFEDEPYESDMDGGGERDPVVAEAVFTALALAQSNGRWESWSKLWASSRHEMSPGVWSGLRATLPHCMDERSADVDKAFAAIEGGGAWIADAVEIAGLEWSDSAFGQRLALAQWRALRGARNAADAESSMGAVAFSLAQSMAESRAERGELEAFAQEGLFEAAKTRAGSEQELGEALAEAWAKSEELQFSWVEQTRDLSAQSLRAWTNMGLFSVEQAARALADSIGDKREALPLLPAQPQGVMAALLAVAEALGEERSAQWLLHEGALEAAEQEAKNAKTKDAASAWAQTLGWARARTEGVALREAARGASAKANAARQGQAGEGSDPDMGEPGGPGASRASRRI
jgi:hypothetical protein